MRNVLWILLGLLVLAPPAAAHGGSTVHSANVIDAHHVPQTPNSTQPVSIHLYVANDTRIESVRAIYCRVQRYACAPALLLTETSPTIYDGIIPWNGNFFEGVTQVGYKFEIRYVDGTNETSPISHYPQRPPELPPGGDLYYYYTITVIPEAPGPEPLLLVAVVILVAAWRRRR